MRLAPHNLDRLGPETARFAYDRETQKIGIVHFGIGAFHRAHQAWYTDLAMDAGDRDWAICGVSLRSRAVADQLNPQSGLYTVTQRAGEQASTRVVGAVREVLFAPEQAAQVVARIASPDCRIVSFTVTEKGYARSESGGLDIARAQSSFYPLLAQGLAQRQRLGLPGITLLSCDNLADNGRHLHRLMIDWCTARAPELAEWFSANCTVPSTMVDRIVPRATSADLAELEGRLGMFDAGAVFTECFSQWVIEDRFAAGRPCWEHHGAQIVSDVAPYEAAKLRMLNGAHSLLAYCGLRAGHEFVHEAVADADLAKLAQRLMVAEAAPSVAAAQGQDLDAYAAQLMQRFADPALRHRLAQIAMDGTQKIPQRWLATADWQVRHGGEPRAIVAAFDAWLWHLADGRFVDDPHGAELVQAMQTGGREAVLDLCFKGSRSAPLWPAYAHLLQLFS